MGILKILLSIGAGIVTAAASFILINKSEVTTATKSTSSDPEVTSDVKLDDQSIPEPKTNHIVKRLDQYQVNVMSYARFITDTLRLATSLVKAMNYKEYDEYESRRIQMINNSYYQNPQMSQQVPPQMYMTPQMSSEMVEPLTIPQGPQVKFSPF